jgi:hypothetical protein
MSASVNNNEILSRLTWRDTLAYLLAYALWIIFIIVSGVLLLLLRGAITPPFAILLFRNPYYLSHTVELGGTVNSVDRLALIVLAIVWVVYILWLEEWFRGAVKQARERRIRAVFSDGEPPPVEAGLQRWSLDLFPRRAAIATIFPIMVMGLYALLQGVLWLLTR